MPQRLCEYVGVGWNGGESRGGVEGGRGQGGDERIGVWDGVRGVRVEVW